MKAQYNICAEGVVVEIEDKDTPDNRGAWTSLTIEQAQQLVEQLNVAISEHKESDRKLNEWLDSFTESQNTSCGCQSVCGECFDG